MFRVGGEMTYKLLRGRLIPQESSSIIMSFLMKSDRSFSSSNRQLGLLYDLFNHPEPSVKRKIVRKTIPQKHAGEFFTNNVVENPPKLIVQKPIPPKSDRLMYNLQNSHNVKTNRPKADVQNTIPQKHGVKNRIPKPAVQKTNPTEPFVQKTEPPKPDVEKRIFQKTNPLKPDVQKTKPPKPDVQKKKPPKHDAQKTKPPKPNAQKTKPPKPDVQKSKPPKPDVQKTIPPKPDVQKTKPPNPHVQKTKPPKPDVQKTIPPKPDAQKTIPPKPDVQKTKPPKPDELCKDGQSQEAIKLLELMHEKGTIPEVNNDKPAALPIPAAENAYELFRKLKETKLVHNAVAILNGLSRWILSRKGFGSSKKHD